MLDLFLELPFPIVLFLLFLHPLLFCILESLCKHTAVVLLQGSAFEGAFKLAQPLLLPFAYRLKIFLLVVLQILPIWLAPYLLKRLQPLLLLLFHEP